MKTNRDRMLPSPKRRPGSNTAEGSPGVNQALRPAPAVRVAAAPRQFQTRWTLPVRL